jgi:ribulose-5-phosphate 4-epimerase/fuculose-1-phosphate aldolase
MSVAFDNPHGPGSPGRPAHIPEAEWQARIDLAVAYRAAAHFGWNDTKGFQFLDQEATFFHDRISYYRYAGIEERPDEVQALADALAPQHHTLILRNHGVVVAGRTVQSAFVRLQYLLICARSQLLANAAATPPDELPEAICKFTREQFEAQEARSGFVHEMAALRRRMDRVLPGYAT